MRSRARCSVDSLTVFIGGSDHFLPVLVVSVNLDPIPIADAGDGTFLAIGFPDDRSRQFVVGKVLLRLRLPIFVPLGRQPIFLALPVVSFEPLARISVNAA